jgi:ribosomal protein S18 acetylase RimI-like enzyme
MNHIRAIDSQIFEPIAELHAQAFHDSLHTRLGQTYVHRLLHWFVEDPERISLAACDDANRVVGYVLGAPLEQLGEMSRRLLPTALRGVMLKPWLLINSEFRRVCLSRLYGLVGTAPVGVPHDVNLTLPIMSLVGIGVAANARGQGVGRALMQAFETASRDRQMGSLELTVRQENAAAIRLYEGAGWIPSQSPGELTTTLRYVKSLSPAVTGVTA